ncbi:MAG TPA: DUF4288 domain-containing protein [Catalimonadaceae bacterium]|nr:DUF4288 domain-containing protein [Catalimonadaceae bacterium]HPI09532.1 DUF4288 domain-containing protein [Catalimonadaceae bacterium]
MHTFLTTLVFQIFIENHNGMAQFDEQVRLIEAPDLETAWEKARCLGFQEQDEFLNHLGRLVSWNFIAVADVFPLSRISDGGHVYSVTHEADDASVFIGQIREKSKATASYFSISIPVS